MNIDWCRNKTARCATYTKHFFSITGESICFYQIIFEEKRTGMGATPQTLDCNILYMILFKPFSLTEENAKPISRVEFRVWSYKENSFSMASEILSYVFQLVNAALLVLEQQVKKMKINAQTKQLQYTFSFITEDKKGTIVPWTQHLISSIYDIDWFDKFSPTVVRLPYVWL